MRAQRYGYCMRAAPNGRAKVYLRGEEFDALLKHSGLDTVQAQADEIGVDSGNLSRILRGQAVSAEFIALTQLKYPKVPFERLFRVAVS